MEHLAPVVEQLRSAKRELEQELATIEKMLAVSEPKEEKPGRWGGKGKDPNKVTEAVVGNGGGKTKKYAVKPEIVDDLLQRVRAHKDQGRSFHESIPGSVVAKDLAEEAGLNIGTVRRALQQLEKEGKVTSKSLSWKDLGKDKPSGATKVMVAN